MATPTGHPPNEEFQTVPNSVMKTDRPAMKDDLTARR